MPLAGVKLLVRSAIRAVTWSLVMKQTHGREEARLSTVRRWLGASLELRKKTPNNRFDVALYCPRLFFYLLLSQAVFVTTTTTTYL